MSLIEVVVFIVVLGIGLAGILVLYNRLTTASVDPMVRKQALAIASSLLEEIELRPFTYCDPDDPNVYTATAANANPGNCTALLEQIGREAGETRYGAPLFDNVNDYDLFGMAGSNPLVATSIRDINDTVIQGLDSYLVAVRVVEITAGELPNVTATSDALRITVTVTSPPNVIVSLQGYRLRYAPNSP